MRRTHSPPQSDPESAERPRKRLRNDTRPSSTSCRQLLLEEVDLEIALQERLAATVQSRITWALLLQQAVEKDVSGSGVHSFGFRDAALDALAAVEAPCEVLFTREAQPNPSLRPSVPSTPSALIPVEGLQTRTRGLHRTARPPPRKLLFLRNTSKFPPQIVKLACPDCSRTDFSSLQGILNHCHLGHNREFGSHDDCVQSCAVLVEDPEEQAWVVSNGTEVAGVSLPGLRRLFELAVGGGMGLLPTAVAVQPKEEKRITPEPTAPLQEGLNSLAQPTEEQITTVTRTLGVHSDSPALAPFLGRAPTKRRIKVYNEEEIVDICGAASATTPRATWRKQYAHRNNARAGLDEVTVSSLPDHPAAAAETVHVPSPTQPLRASSSRFHIAARVSIRDISQSIPQSRRVSEHTHRWRLAVTSPSYSLPISSFLKKLTVTCLTDPPPSSMTEPIVVEKAPFFITGTTDRPFLARLTFTWASEDKNPQKDVDHWVEVDPIHLSNPVLGDEQVFDVEIDRRTDLLSTDTDPDSDAFDFGGTRSDLHNGQDDSENKGTGKSSTTQGPDYARKLRSLLPLVPMTLKDVKGKLPRQPPYTLVSTPAQYRGLLYGRRKALEWARARALLQAYDDLCSSSAPTNGKPHVTLTAVDVLHWLEDEGHFPRSITSATPQMDSRPGTATPRREPSVKAEENASAAEVYCRYCGLHNQYHPSAATVGEQSMLSSSPGATEVKAEPTVANIPDVAVPSACISFCEKRAEIPPIDVNRFLIPLEASQAAQLKELPESTPSSDSHGSTSSRALVGAADPALTIAFQKLCSTWKLAGFPSAPNAAPFGTSESKFTGGPLVKMNRSREDVEEDLAPYALLSLLTRSVIKALIQGGVDEYRRDEAGVRALGIKHRSRKNVEVKRFLTPSHILRGLASGASPPGDTSLLTVFAPLGMSLPTLGESDVPATGGDP